MVASLLGAVFGFITTWFERFGDVGSSIGLTFLGVFQVAYTLRGFYAIRKALQKRAEAKLAGIQTQTQEEKEWIEKHRNYMMGLWLFCLTPAWFRIPELLGAGPNTSYMFLALFFTTPFANGYIRATESGSFW